jgi:hypothetical protein
VSATGPYLELYESTTHLSVQFLEPFFLSYANFFASHLTANWKSGERCSACRHAKRSVKLREQNFQIRANQYVRVWLMDKQTSYNKAIFVAK